MDQPSQPPAGDIPYSYSRPDLVAVTHTRLELTVNFASQVLVGKAILTVEKKVSRCNELVLDTYGLDIFGVSSYSPGQILYSILGNHHNNFGRKLTITLPNVDSADQTVPTSSKQMEFSDNIYTIQIGYRTSPQSPALYWLRKEQTSDDEPLLISNSKLTYARAIFPCQDTPSNKMTFYSKISVPKSLNIMVMMPGSKEMSEAYNRERVIYSFSQNITMAPYEIYIIVGSLRSLRKSREFVFDRPMDLEIWAEEQSRQRCTSEFLNKIMDILCNIKKSYGFLGESVNVCVLPPNVPEFDMQYPDMTFVSSSLLEGQYSLIDTFVQNIIESWIGRTVTIDNFEHLWLIKGLSTFIYRNPKNDEIIDEEMKFRLFANLKIKSLNNLLSMPQLLNTVSLVPDFTNGLLPMNIIKYVSEKGCVFLNYLQDILGGPEKFHPFLVLCIENRRILTSDRFKTSLYEYFSHKHKILNIAVNWDKWFNEPRFPASHPYIMDRRKTFWQGQADLWIAQKIPSFDTIGLDQSNDLAIIEFLTYLLTLSTVLAAYQLRKIEHEFLRDQNICEIRFLWLRLCIKNRWSDDGRILEDALKFACEYCMPKYACPIFRDLYEWEVTRELARTRFRNTARRPKMLRETINGLSSILFPLDDRA